jgi:hypothetical protein
VFVPRKPRLVFLRSIQPRVRISVQADGTTIIREGHGNGEGRAHVSSATFTIRHSRQRKTDATQTCLGHVSANRSELALYRSDQPRVRDTSDDNHRRMQDQRFGFSIPDDTTPIPRPSRFYGRRKYPPIAEQLRRQGASLGPPALVPLEPSPDSDRIDKSQLAIAQPRRLRDKTTFEIPSISAVRDSASGSHLTHTISDSPSRERLVSR